MERPTATKLLHRHQPQVTLVVGNLCSQDPLSKPPFGKTKVGAHFTPCHSISLLGTQCPKCFQIERPTKTRRTDFTGLDEQLPCRVQLLLLLHTEPVFLRRVFHSPQIIFTLPHLCMAGLCQYERVQLHTEPFFCATVARLFSTRRGKTRTCCFPRHRNVSYSSAHCAIVQLSSLVTQVVIKCHL